MFCPNCGTPNPETAQACSKCAFVLKNAAAPKFKGTMLMVNPPAGGGGPTPRTPLPPTPEGGPGGTPLPSPAGAIRGPGGLPSKLKGTMVGVAPPVQAGLGASAGTPVLDRATSGSAPPPAGGGTGGGATLAFSPGAPAQVGATPAYSPPAARAYAPPEPRAPVNPLGGTVAADAVAYAAAFAPHPAATPNPHGQAQTPGAAKPGGGGQTIALGALGGNPAGFGQGPYGAPGTQAVPADYGNPGGAQPQGGSFRQDPGVGAFDPQGHAPAPYPPGPQAPYPPGPQAPYPPAPQAPYPPGPQAPYAPGGYGQQPGALALADPQAVSPYAPALAGTLQSRGTPGVRGPTRRNALMTWLLPILVMVVGGTVATILGFVLPILSLLAPVAELAGAVWYLLLAIAMVGEVRTVTRNDAFAWWPILVPIYGMYWAWILVPQEVAKAKQLLGLAKPPQHIVLYIFLWHFALATDLNEMAAPR